MGPIFKGQEAQEERVIEFEIGNDGDRLLKRRCTSTGLPDYTASHHRKRVVRNGYSPRKMTF
jgi:hypothetical protein